MSIEFLFYTFRLRTKRSSCLDDALSKKFFNKQKQDLSNTALVNTFCIKTRKSMPIKIATTEVYNSYHKKKTQIPNYSGTASFLMKKI